MEYHCTFVFNIKQNVQQVSKCMYLQLYHPQFDHNWRVCCSICMPCKRKVNKWNFYRLEIPSENVKAVYRVANHLKMADAVAACSNFLAASISLDNCLGSWPLPWGRPTLCPASLALRLWSVHDSGGRSCFLLSVEFVVTVRVVPLDV